METNFKNFFFLEHDGTGSNIVIKFTLHTKLLQLFLVIPSLEVTVKKKKSVMPTKISQQILIGGCYDFNLNPLLKLLSYPLITSNNNFLIIIYCENVIEIVYLFHIKKKKKNLLQLFLIIPNN